MLSRRTASRTGLTALAASILLVTAWVPAAVAIPALQLYVEGATYDTDTESWILAGASDFKLWVIGNTGHYGSIMDVKLVAAFLTSEAATGSISISPTTATGYTDPSTPSIPTVNTSVGADGTLPVMSDGRSLPTHGIYGPGTSFIQWELGDFDLVPDSPVGDFINGFPTSFPQMGQINAYNISTSGFTMVHFDAFNHVGGANHALFAPFSHDAGAAVPEPGSLVLLGVGLAGAAWARRRKRGT